MDMGGKGDAIAQNHSHTSLLLVHADFLDVSTNFRGVKDGS